MTIFSMTNLEKKAYREIERLIKTEQSLEQQVVIDHALNTAFTARLTCPVS